MPLRSRRAPAKRWSSIAALRLVDDDPLVLTMFCTILAALGYALSVLASQGYAVEQVDAFLEKPFVPAILANRVRELLT